MDLIHSIQFEFRATFLFSVCAHGRELKDVSHNLLLVPYFLPEIENFIPIQFSFECCFSFFLDCATPNLTNKTSRLYEFNATLLLDEPAYTRSSLFSRLNSSVHGCSVLIRSSDSCARGDTFAQFIGGTPNDSQL